MYLILTQLYNYFFAGKAAMIQMDIGWIDQIPEDGNSKLFFFFLKMHMVSSPETFGWAIDPAAVKKLKKEPCIF